MKHGRCAQGVELRIGKAQVLSELDRVRLNAAQMIVGTVVFRLNSKGQGLNRSKMEVSNLFGVFLLCFQAVQIDAVGTVHPVDKRQDEDGELPTERSIDETYASCDHRAQQVVGKRPQVAFFPN